MCFKLKGFKVLGDLEEISRTLGALEDFKDLENSGREFHHCRQQEQEK
jgi:hypothetical protein